jgi:iron complex outermembrane recepter protein
MSFKPTPLAAALALAFAGAATAQPAERIEITGSAIKRIDAETALPVTIMTREEIQRSGAVSTEQLLQSIAAVSSQGGISNSMGAGNSTYGQSSISLRGLGEDRTLVLVNGRRLSAFAGGNGASINLNSIPVAAIERVEVFKDGAGALYGSDAIAGVVNFILKKDHQGFEVSATVGKPTRGGGGGSKRAAVVAGFGDKSRFNVTLSATVEREDQLFAKDREFAKTGNIFPFVSAAATGQGNIEGAYNPATGGTFTAAEEATVGNTPGRFNSGFGGSPGTGYGNPLALQDQCASIRMYLDPNQTTKGAPYCTYDSSADVGLLPERELGTFSANVSFRLTQNLEIFGDALYSKSRIVQQFQPSPLRRSFMVSDALFFTQGVEPVLLLRPSNPNYAIADAYLRAMAAANPGGPYDAIIGRPLAVTARVFDFGPRTQDDESTDTRLTAGLRGNFGSVDWEVAVGSNRNKIAGTVPDGYFSQVAFARVVNDPASDYNPWSLTQSATFNQRLAASGAKYTGSTLDGESRSDSVDGLLRGEFGALGGGPVQYAAGFQYRKEKLDTQPSAALSTGDIAGLGGATPPVTKDRTIGSLFAEFNMPFIKGLEGNVQGRHDRYDDVGNASTFKGSVRWQPVSNVALRGSVGTGFRAPTLIDLWRPQTLGTSEQFNDPGTGQTDLQVNSLAGGNPDLEPEKSRQRSLGVVLQPTRDVSLSLDYFMIKVRDIISTPSAQEVVSRFRAGDPAFAGLVILTPGSNDIDSIIQTLQNVGTADVRGVDLELNVRQPLLGGRLDVNWAGTYMMKFDQTSPGGAVSRKVGTMVEGDDGVPVLSTSGVNDGVVLRYKHRLAATYGWGPVEVTLAQNYTSGYRDGNDLNNSKHRVPSQSIYDGQLAFTGVKGLRLAVGAKNLFDKDPPIFIPTSNQFQAGYDITQYDPRGRFVYVNASYRF